MFFKASPILPTGKILRESNIDKSKKEKNRLASAG